MCACPCVCIFFLSFKVRYVGSSLFRYLDEWTDLRPFSIRSPSYCSLCQSLPFDHWWVCRMYVPIQINRRLYRRDEISLDNHVSIRHSNIPPANRRHYRRLLNVKYKTFRELHVSHIHIYLFVIDKFTIFTVARNFLIARQRTLEMMRMQIFACCQMLNSNCVTTFDNFPEWTLSLIFIYFFFSFGSELNAHLPAFKLFRSHKPNGPVAIDILFLFGASHRLLTRSSSISHIMRMQSNGMIDIP